MQVIKEPNKYGGLVQGLQNLLSGILQQSEQKRRTQDIGDIGGWARGGFQGQPPQFKTHFGQQLGGQMIMNMPHERGPKATKDEIHYWTGKGYALKDAVKNARLAAEISAGIAPRASTRSHYDNMTDPEKLKFLTTLKRSAEGPYFGVEGGNVEPLNAPVAEWANSELENLPMLQQQGIKVYNAQTGEPRTFESKEELAQESDEPVSVEEFYDKVAELKDSGDMDAAKDYYEQWVSKWQ